MPDTAAVRVKTRRVKDHILDKYLKLAERLEANDELSDHEKAKYWELTMVFAKSVLPRTQEVTGEDGGAVQVTMVKYGDTTTLPIPAEELPASDSPSVR